jgi:ribonuclease HI
LYADGRVDEFGAASPHTTNNQMELQAAIEALEHLGQLSNVTVYTDSRYVIDGLTKWMSAWRRRGWVTATGTAVKNRALWQKLAQLSHPSIRWQHVRGHTGDPNNERVDDIARAFASGQVPQLYHGHIGTPEDPVQNKTAPSAVHPEKVSSRSRPAKFSKPQYVSIVKNRVALDDNWAACEARVRGVSGARYKKVRTPEELEAFCSQHGVAVPCKACI